MTTATTQLPDFKLMKFSGKDSAKLLQGQFTCDVMKMGNDEWLPGACCNAKGRMVANFTIVRNDTDFILRLRSDLAEILKTHLAKYAVFYKTKIEILESTPQGSFGSTAAERKANWNDSGVTLQWPDGRQEYWPNESEQQAAIENSLIEKWHKADINAGMAWVDASTTEAWIPQHVGWENIGGVNFKKGCYTGQEVVARLQYLGKAKKQLALVETTDGQSQAIETGSSMTLDGKTIGDIISWCGDRGLAIANVSETTVATIKDIITVSVTPLFQSDETADQPND